MAAKENKSLNIIKQLVVIITLFHPIWNMAIQPSKKENFKILNRIQYAALKVISGSMKSTPINTLPAENAVTALEQQENGYQNNFY